MRLGGGSFGYSADTGSERGRDYYRAGAGVRCGVCRADLFEWIYRRGYEDQPGAVGGAVRDGVQHRRERGLSGAGSRMEVVWMSGRGGFDRYGAGVDDAAGVAALAGAERTAL